MKIILVDDHKLIREGLRRILLDVPDIQIVAEADDGRAAVQLVEDLSPDVVVMDIDMPNLNGIEATRQICSKGKATKVLALTASASPQSARKMLKAGASGYVVKTSAFREFAGALKSLQSGKVYLSPGLSETLIHEMVSEKENAPSAFSVLSGREREVLQLLAEGKATKEVAIHLHVSVKTIETHRKNIMEKLDLYSVAELTKYAIREGLTSV
jgi:DNA-binding NarL/FixJ family response regulator